MALTSIGGVLRFAYGSVKYPTPPEPGTIVGPHPITREPIVILGTDAEGRTWLAPATEAEVAARPDNPRSVAEAELSRLTRSIS